MRAGRSDSKASVVSVPPVRADTALQLVIYKYQIRSTAAEGHTTAEFGTGVGQKPFLHTPLSTATAPF